MDAEERFGPRHDFEMIQKYEGLDQLTDVGGADEARDGAVPVAAGGEGDPARAGDWRILDIENTAARDGYCGTGAHFNLHEA
jgi:hypothetical protein